MENKIFDVFPKLIQDYTMEVKEGLNLNMEYILGSVLTAASIGIGNSFQVKVKNGWYVGANLFVVIVGSTGVAKTPAISMAMSPIIKRNQEYMNEYKIQKTAYKDFLDLPIEERKRINDNVAEPVLKKTIAEEATIEAIFRAHANNPKGFGIYYDEVLGFFYNMSKYNNGSDQEHWLKMWSGKSITVDRASSEPIFIPKPHISVIGGTQTDMVHELFKNNRNKNGFVERILFIMPDNLIKADFPENPVANYVLDNYERAILRLVDQPVCMDEKSKILPNTLEFESEAYQLFINYYNQNAQKHRSGNLPKGIEGFYPKMDTYFVRFALILQLLYWTCEENDNDAIGVRAVKGAMALSDYFLDNALKVLNHIQKPVSLNNEHRRLFAIDFHERNPAYSYRDIGSLIGVSHETVRKWIKPKS